MIVEPCQWPGCEESSAARMLVTRMLATPKDPSVDPSLTLCVAHAINAIASGAYVRLEVVPYVDPDNGIEATIVGRT